MNPKKIFVVMMALVVPLALGSSQTFSLTFQTDPDSISFAPAVNYGAGDTPYCVFCADLDGDSDLDLAVANFGSDSISILENLSQVPGNSAPYPFPLLSPADGDTTSRVVNFNWANAYDPNLGDQIRYDLYISTSPEFPPPSTIIHSNLTMSHHTDILVPDAYYWKVKARDNWGAKRWSNQTWSFIASYSVPPPQSPLSPNGVLLSWCF